MRKLVAIAAILFTAALLSVQPFSVARAQQTGIGSSHGAGLTIGGEPPVILVRPSLSDKTQPFFRQATVFPGIGMNLVQLKAFLPGKGEINVITTKTLPELKQFLETDNDAFGNNSFRLGGAILLPYPNRIRGTLSADGKTITTNIAGQQVELPANWKGQNPGAEAHAMHGLILSSAFQDVQKTNNQEASSVSAILHAGNFNGHWPSQTDVEVNVALKSAALEITVTTTNVGDQNLPMAIGMHPYFEIPSGDRKQARLHIPADTRAIVNNYDDVFPTGQLVPVKGTPYDFTAAGGVALGNLSMDDSFTNLRRNRAGNAVIEMTDPKAKYGVRITTLAPEIKAIQVYAPPDKNFVAIEPQFNLADPYSNIWGGNANFNGLFNASDHVYTGMVLLAPGKSVSWRIRIEVFSAGAQQ
jgi:aldose 1-epimerase